MSPTCPCGAMVISTGGEPCPFCDGYICSHEWVRQRQGGPPDMAESYEVVEFCKLCGMERVEE